MANGKSAIRLMDKSRLHPSKDAVGARCHHYVSCGMPPQPGIMVSLHSDHFFAARFGNQIKSGNIAKFMYMSRLAGVEFQCCVEL